MHNLFNGYDVGNFNIKTERVTGKYTLFAYFQIMMIEDDQPWMIVQEKVNIYDKFPAFICCDRRQHLLILNYQANKNATTSSTSSTINLSDQSSINNGRSTHTIEVQTVSKSVFFLRKKNILKFYFSLS